MIANETREILVREHPDGVRYVLCREAARGTAGQHVFFAALLLVFGAVGGVLTFFGSVWLARTIPGIREPDGPFPWLGLATVLAILPIFLLALAVFGLTYFILLAYLGRQEVELRGRRLRVRLRLGPLCFSLSRPAESIRRLLMGPVPSEDRPSSETGSSVNLMAECEGSRLLLAQGYPQAVVTPMARDLRERLAGSLGASGQVRLDVVSSWTQPRYDVSLCVAGILLVGAGFSFFVMGLGWFVDLAHFVTTAERAHGVVVKVGPRTKPSTSPFSGPEVQFDRQTQTIVIGWVEDAQRDEPWPNYPVGARMEVLFHPDRPDQARLPWSEQLYGGPSAFTGVGCTCMVVGLILFRSGRKRKTALRQAIVKPIDHAVLEQRIQSLLERGDKIAAIQLYCEITGTGIAEAKRAVEGM